VVLATWLGVGPTACGQRAEEVENLEAASGVAYKKLGAILTFLAAPNFARQKAFGMKSQHYAMSHNPSLANFQVTDNLGVGSLLSASAFVGTNVIPPCSRRNC
jgi:hypothetical protein